MCNNACCIYGLFDPRDGKCHYVGQTSDRNSRERSHTNNCWQGNRAKHAWVNELLELKLKPEFRVLEEVDDWLQLNARELIWVRQLAAQGHPIKNRAVGAITKKDLISLDKVERLHHRLAMLRDLAQSCEMDLYEAVDTYSGGQIRKAVSRIDCARVRIETLLNRLIMLVSQGDGL